MSYTSFTRMKAEMAHKPGTPNAAPAASPKSKPTKRHKMIAGFVKRHGR
jgi:hypothetical protein